MGNLTQDGRQTAAGTAPVGIEINDYRPGAHHFPVSSAPIGNHILEPVLIDGMNGIDGIWILDIALGADAQGDEGQQDCEK